MTLWPWPVITLSFETPSFFFFFLSLGLFASVADKQNVDAFPPGCLVDELFQRKSPPNLNGHVYSSTALPTDGKGEGKKKTFTLTGAPMRPYSQNAFNLIWNVEPGRVCWCAPEISRNVFLLTQTSIIFLTDVTNYTSKSESKWGGKAWIVPKQNQLISAAASGEGGRRRER